MTSDRSMSLILCGDLKQDQQENSLLRFIVTNFGMQLINMTSTKIQNKHRERPSFHIKMVHVMILNMILKKKILQLIKINMTLPHTQSFQSSFNSSAPKKPTKVFIPYQLWRQTPEAVK